MDASLILQTQIHECKCAVMLQFIKLKVFENIIHSMHKKLKLYDCILFPSNTSSWMLLYKWKRNAAITSQWTKHEDLKNSKFIIIIKTFINEVQCTSKCAFLICFLSYNYQVWSNCDISRIYEWKKTMCHRTTFNNDLGLMLEFIKIFIRVFLCPTCKT